MKNKKTRIQERRENYLNVPTYLFPEANEYSEEVIYDENKNEHRNNNPQQQNNNNNNDNNE